MKEMKTLTINGQQYEVVDEIARNAISELEESTGNSVEIDTTLTKSGAAADSSTVGNEVNSLWDAVAEQTLSEVILPYDYGTEDLVDGVSELATGRLYFVYAER